MCAGPYDGVSGAGLQCFCASLLTVAPCVERARPCEASAVPAPSHT